LEHLLLPRLVSGDCPTCPSTEIVVKAIRPHGLSYEDTALAVAWIAGTLIDGAMRAVVLK